MENLGLKDMFVEPADFYQADSTPTFISYERQNPAADEPAELTLRLVGKSPLWGHLLWNAGRVSAEFVDSHRETLRGKTVLELGAAAALPSLLASLVARNVVCTDYPDPDLIQNIEHNKSLLEKHVGHSLPMTSMGYIWGHDVEPLLNCPAQNGELFDFIILSDLVFNHAVHRDLVETCARTIKPDGCILVVFTPHRPKLYNRDLNFFTLAEQRGFHCNKIIERKMQPMFEEEEATKELRSMVFGYILTPRDL